MVTKCSAYIYIYYVYIWGVWGAAAPQKPTTHYKNKIKWRLFLYCEPGYFFIFFSGQARLFFFLLFSETNYFFLLSSETGYFFLSKPETGFFFWKITQPPPPPRISNGRPLTQGVYDQTFDKVAQHQVSLSLAAHGIFRYTT